MVHEHVPVGLGYSQSHGSLSLLPGRCCYYVEWLRMLGERNKLAAGWYRLVP